MNDRPDHAPGPVDPDPAGTPAQQAAELVIDGLLRSLAARSESGHAARVDRVVRALHEGEARTPRPMPAPHEALRRPRPRRGWLRSLALLAMAAAVLILISRTGVPGENAVLAQVRGAISSMRLPGDRRYEIRVFTNTGAEVNAVPDTIDARYPAGHLLVRHHPPFCPADIFVGRDETGLWSIGRSGAVNRQSPKRDLPPWASLENEWILGDTVDQLLEALTAAYDLTPGPPATDTIEGGDEHFTRVTAVRKAARRFSPDRVELWIHPGTRAVERVELHWDAALSGQPRSTKRDGERAKNGSGERRGPPLKVILQRVDSAPFPDDWFSPAAHAGPAAPAPQHP